MASLYIPPTGLYFRLLGLNSNKVLFSRNGTDPEFWHHPVGETYDDQWWHLSPGSGKHEGYYLVVSKYTGKVIFSRSSPDPHVGHIGGGGVYEDNWFKIEAGTGKRANFFRLREKSTDTVLVSRPATEPQVCNHPGTSEIYDDQYFTFLFEDTKIDRIEYDINRGLVLSRVPELIGTQTELNYTDVNQTVEFDFSRTETISSSFDYTLGFTITVGASGKVGIPFVAEGAIKVDLSNSHTMKWGSTTTQSRTYASRFPATAPPHTKITATASVTCSQIEIPFTIYSKSVATGFEVRTEGTYRGVTYWDIQSDIKQESL